MIFNKILLFLDMDGYAFFIWSAYAFWFILLMLLSIKVISRKKNIEKKIKEFNLKE